MESIKRFFSPPLFEYDKDKTRRARNVYIIAMVGLMMTIFILSVLFLLSPQNILRLLIVGASIPVSLFELAWLRSGHIHSTSVIQACFIWLAVVVSSIFNGGLSSMGFTGGTIIAVLLSGILLNWQGTIAFIVASILAGMGLAWGETQGLVNPAQALGTPLIMLATYSVFLVVSAYLMYISNQSIRQALSLARIEIDERMRVQEQLSASEEKYRNYIEQSTEGIWLLAFDEPISVNLPPEEQVRLIQSRGYIADCNDALARMYGLASRQEMIGRLLLDLYGDSPSKTNFQSTLQLVHNDYRSGERLTEEINTQGKQVYFLNNAVGVIKEEQLVGLWGTQRDITESMQAEEALRRQAHEMSLLYQFGLSLAAGQDLYGTLRALQEEISQLIQADSLFVAIYDENTDTVSYPLAFDLGVPQDEPPRRLKDKPGFTGAVIFSGKTLYLPDSMSPEAEEAYQPVDHSGMVLHTFLGIPLVSKGRVIGVLSVQAQEIDAYSPDQIQLVETLAVQAAFAIDKANLLEQLQHELSERIRAEQVQVASRRISEAALMQSLPEFYQSVYTIISPLIPTRNFYITLYNATSNTFFTPFLVDEFDSEWPPYQPGKGLGGFVLRTGKPLLATPDVFAEMERQGQVEIVARRMVEWLGVPLRTRQGKNIGVMAVQIYSGPPRLDSSHMDLMMFVSVQVAMAIERMQAEAEREKLIQELTAKNNELERFTYTVSHDLKAPLITIRGFLGYLEEDAISGNLERLKGDVQRITGASSKMYKLLDELLILSRIGRLKNPPINLPFGEIVQEALGMVEGRLRPRQIEVRVEPNLPVVNGDRPRLVEVLQNLIDNAAKFIGEQPEPSIEIGQQGVDVDGKPILFVRDNGIGIEPQYYDKIFGLFNKLDAQTDGTGVGLALVKRIIEVHECKIWVESEPGQGSTFFFTLPNESESEAGE